MPSERVEPISESATAPSPVDPLDADAVIDLFGRICDRTAAALADNDDWSMSGDRVSQYSVDVVVDAICLEALHGAGFAVLSEESGITAPGGAVLDDVPDHVVVVDPLDGSTNAALGLPWCATALCLVSDGRPAVSMVANLRTGARFTAAAGRGAFLDGRPLLVPNGETSLEDAIVAINARAPGSFRPRQFRAMGATALDITAVAAGGFDGTVDFAADRIGVWDYLAAVHVLEEAGGVAVDARGRELVVLDPDERRAPVTASTVELLAALVATTS